MKKVQLNLLVRQEIRDELRKLAAEKIIKDPSQQYTACQIAVDIIEKYLDDNREKPITTLLI